MDNTMERKPLNLGGLLVFFVAFTVAGPLLAYIYLGAIDLIPYIQLNIFIAIAYGVALFWFVNKLKKWLKITNNKGATVFAVLGIIVINYFKWQTFFGVWYSRWFGMEISYLNVPYVLDALHYMIIYPFDHGLNPVAVFFQDLSTFNYYGTWNVFDMPLSGWMLSIVWVLQFAILFFVPIAAAWSPVAIMLNGEWAIPKYQPYNFVPFEEGQIERLTSFQDTGVITGQPLAGKNSELVANEQGVITIQTDVTEIVGKISLVGQLYTDDTPTDYIIISTAKVAKIRTLNSIFGKPTEPIHLGTDKITNLMDELVKLHGVAGDYDENDINEEFGEDFEESIDELSDILDDVIDN